MKRQQLTTWMHGWLGIAITVGLLTVGSAHAENAGNIVWVTKARDGVVPADWLPILTNAGYTVTGFTGGMTPTASEVDELNAADLVIYDNSHGSRDAGDAATWNSLSVPLLTMANYPPQ